MFCSSDGLVFEKLEMTSRFFRSSRFSYILDLYSVEIGRTRNEFVPKLNIEYVNINFSCKLGHQSNFFVFYLIKFDEVIKLDRVFFAGITKKNLQRGQWRYLDKKEIDFLQMKGT